MKKPRENRVPIMMSDDELKAIDDWRFENRVATRSDAVRKLAQIGKQADQDLSILLKMVLGSDDKLREEYQKILLGQPEAHHGSLFKMRVADLKILTEIISKILAISIGFLPFRGPQNMSSAMALNTDLQQRLGQLDLSKEDDRKWLTDFTKQVHAKNSKIDSQT